ncbi:M50 family metallopeptidase [Aquibacillus salsiterrae]|uniref:M50 family metallopeptidase n=1 Tax=Aquibacillus salsiterrae TaxID=2950439 RepID=A0A9X3WAW5_9BACI|nr:M50 family metallopeptidase [Aquibacillus salsiterrae]MDC3416015.1 M50 family metallopeptidase [Aquibacillus salsiterrae]
MMERDLIIYIFLAFLLCRIPLVGVYVRLINTVVHEIFHVLVAKLTGGKGYRISLQPDTSGQALVSSSSWLSTIFTAYAGYTGSSIMAFVIFYLLSENYYVAVICLFFGLLLLSALLWIRNFFGVSWALSLAAILGFLLYYEQKDIFIPLAYMIASVILIESVYSALQVMIISFRSPSQAGDAASLQKLTLIPAFLWGMLFFIQALYIGYKTIVNFVI